MNYNGPVLGFFSCPIQDGQNSIIIIPGANDKLTTRDVYAAVPGIISVSK